MGRAPSLIPRSSFAATESRSFVARGSLVTQLGAESVTNPDGEALPEIVTADIYGDGDPNLTFNQGSTRMARGAKVMAWEDDYLALSKLIATASDAFKLDHGLGEEEVSLDIEYKKDTDGSLSIKQIRPLEAL